MAQAHKPLDPDAEFLAIADGKLEELKALREQINARIKQIEEAKAIHDQKLEHKPEAPTKQTTGVPSPEVAALELKLSKLDWKLAASKACDWVKDSVPSDVLAAARVLAVKGRIDGEKCFYIVKEDGAILRFRRKGSQVNST
jgi:hypothetical protein